MYISRLQRCIQIRRKEPIKGNEKQKIKKITIAVVLFIFFFGLVYLLNINNFKRDGQFEISLNDESITIHRDENGIAYIFAQNKADAIRGQGFVTAQDRISN